MRNWLTLYSSRIAGLYESSRMLWIYVTIGGLITVIISLIGLIGYTNDEINRRRKEIAIRKINGASVRTILRIFLGDILRITSRQPCWVAAFPTSFRNTGNGNLPRKFRRTLCFLSRAA